MQWFGTKIYLSGSRRAVIDTTAGELQEIWPGPVTGSFAVQTTKGVGVLLGRDVVLLARFDASSYLLRSARPDRVLIAARDAVGGTVIREWINSRKERELLRIPGAIIDFDVARNGTLTYISADGDVFLAANPDRVSRLWTPAPQNSQRVFLSADADELAVLTPQQLCHLRVDDVAWRCNSFDADKDAVVRHAWSRRIVSEPRATP